MFNYIIVGAGLAGSVMAERIASQLGEKVLVVERRNHIGGNCYDERDDNGILVHRYGPHILHTDSEEVFEYLSAFTGWREYQHRVLGSIDGTRVPLPFNQDSLRMLFPPSLAERLEEKMIEEYGFGSRVPIMELMGCGDPDIEFLADYVYRKVFLNYTMKQWGLEPGDIDPGVTARVPIVLSRDDRYFNDRYQALPVDGYTAMIGRMLDHPCIKLMLNTSHDEVLELRDGRIHFMGSEFRGKLIFTGKIDELFGYRYGELPYRSLDLRFESLDMEWFQEAATVNYPNDYDFTRITEFKHLHPADSRRTTLLREYPCRHVEGENEPFYPVFTDETRAKYEGYLELAREFEDLILVGRLAEYRYYDMDDIVLRALRVFEEMID
ncbi:MAG TPA: UDP-galactopyranose mutase [Methanothermobacter thermautotrophicus]|uniref:UDP-galactopyranose mutase n=1 Tax=Methanothermobacter thermautotrophicus TaxID=145262 RepID=A0A7J4MUP3_METTF|nr:UDP-galactopyranose mutase [Methanothermobacter thermautotrophicus]HIH71702.1 UDP-galactopyranose mutase [Methanothermobacter thermautotrophicus]